MKKLTYEFVKDSFEKDNYVLLSKEYKGNKIKLDYRCPNNHEHSIAFDNWQAGKRCPHCVGNAKPSLESIKESFKSKGYQLLSTEYKNSRTKLNYICPKGHKHSIGWDSWRCGHGCTFCANMPVMNIEVVKERFTMEGYVLLSEGYVNEYSKLSYICPNGHQHSTRWNNWQQGNRCPTCDDIEKTGPGHPNWNGGTSYEPYCSIWADKEYKRDIKERDGHSCLNPYCSRDCNKLHIHHIDYDKKNCGPKNLITVCNSCNAKANYDRDWHKAWYKAIIKKRYNY